MSHSLSIADLEAIENAPIGNGLDAFHDLSSAYGDLSDAVDHMRISDAGEIHRPGARFFLTYIDFKDLVNNLIWVLHNLPVVRSLHSPNGRDTLKLRLLQLPPQVESDEFDIRSAIPLLNKVRNKASDADIWSAVYSLIIESTPPPRPLPNLVGTPIVFNTGSLTNTSEHRKYFDNALKEELNSSLHVDVPGFFDAFFGEVTGLQLLAEVVFKKCQEGEDPLYKAGDGWRYWPKVALEKEVLEWFKEIIDKFLSFAGKNGSGSKVQRRLLRQPNQHLSGLIAKRKLDIGFANSAETSKNLRCNWSEILVPGELKSNPDADKRTHTWFDLARYARNVLSAQDTRRFVLGFTLCGSIMRLWEFDRLGGIASSSFDINKEGLQFVSTVLGYLWMNKEQLGFDPTILESDGKRCVEIMRNNKIERLVIIELIKRQSSVTGRATTAWRAYRDGDESKTILVIKDSWQYPERVEEGELLREATEKGAVNVARYYHHETVHVDGKEDDINSNVRKGLVVKKATDAFLHTSATSTIEGMPTQSVSGVLVDRCKSTAQKRSSSSLNAPLPPHKRSCSTSSHTRSVLPNRVHRRVIVRDYGKHIYKASSLGTMLSALQGNIEGMKYHGDLLYSD
jgi:Fungal protein kinase